MNSSSIYRSAIQDVNEGSGRNIEEYLNSIKFSAKEFIMKKEVYDREEILHNIRTLIRDSGNFVKDRNWNIAKAAKKAGIDRFKLKRYVIIYSIFCI